MYNPYDPHSFQYERFGIVYDLKFGDYVEISGAACIANANEYLQLHGLEGIIIGFTATQAIVGLQDHPRHCLLRGHSLYFRHHCGDLNQLLVHSNPYIRQAASVRAVNSY